jgi:hypothetical protein
MFAHEIYGGRLSPVNHRLSMVFQDAQSLKLNERLFCAISILISRQPVREWL